MQPVIQNLQRYFCHFLNNNEDFITQLKASFTLTASGSWLFSLPQLHQFMIQQNPELANVTYAQFRKAIYQSDLNTQLAQIGGKIVIHENSQNVDQSVYALTRLEATNVNKHV